MALTEQQAIDAANSAAQSDGWNLADYEVPNAVLRGTYWSVSYRGRAPTVVGDHFTVKVDDETSATRIVVGR